VEDPVVDAVEQCFWHQISHSAGYRF
jgi:hypothetical protein